MTQESYNDFYATHYRKLYCGTKTATEEFFNNQITRVKAILDYIEKKN